MIVEPLVSVCFMVRGKPEPAGSKKGYTVGRKVVIVDANDQARQWKGNVAIHARLQMHGRDPLTGPLRVTLTFLCQRPDSHYLSDGFTLSKAGERFLCKTSKPDVLKLARAVEDALTGIVYADDAQIIDERLKKRWTTPGEKEGVYIEVSET